jgi:hypothetical protein
MPVPSAFITKISPSPDGGGGQTLQLLKRTNATLRPSDDQTGELSATPFLVRRTSEPPSTPTT